MTDLEFTSDTFLPFLPEDRQANPGVYRRARRGGRCPRVAGQPPERVYSSHAHDPLNTGQAHDAFSVYCLLAHGGDMASEPPPRVS